MNIRHFSNLKCSTWLFVKTSKASYLIHLGYAAHYKLLITCSWMFSGFTQCVLYIHNQPIISCSPISQIAHVLLHHEEQNKECTCIQKHLFSLYHAIVVLLPEIRTNGPLAHFQKQVPSLQSADAIGVFSTLCATTDITECAIAWRWYVPHKTMHCVSHLRLVEFSSGTVNLLSVTGLFLPVVDGYMTCRN